MELLPRFRPLPILFLALFAGSLSSAREITFEERVSAQRAIERVYHAHQIGATRPFEAAVPESLLERKVRTYFKESAALDRIWGTPITAAALRSEWERHPSYAVCRQAPRSLRRAGERSGSDPGVLRASRSRGPVGEKFFGER